MHDIHYLNDVKYSGLNNCTLIGDKGYLSKTYQTDLFITVRIDLKTPMRNNQQNKERFEPISDGPENALKLYLHNYVTSLCLKETMLKRLQDRQLEY